MDFARAIVSAGLTLLAEPDMDGFVLAPYL